MHKSIRVTIFALTCSTFFSLTAAPAKLPQRLHKHVIALTGTEKARNYLNLKSLNQAATYIEKEFQSFGLKTSQQPYRAQGNKYHNIIARIDRKKSKTIIIGAHYDVCMEQPGADDNASAIAGLLETARLLVKNRADLNYNIEFVAFTLEEPPFFRTRKMGSYIHAQSVKKQKESIALMVCLEMIGYYSNRKNSQRYPLAAMKFVYPNTGNFIAVIGNMTSTREAVDMVQCFNKQTNIDAVGLAGLPGMRGVDFSDHLNYWNLGIKAVMLTDTAFYRNPNYHKKTDTPDTLNYEKMAEVVKGLVTYLIHLKADKRPAGKE